MVYCYRLKRLHDTGYRFRTQYFCKLYADKKLSAYALYANKNFKYYIKCVFFLEYLVICSALPTHITKLNTITNKSPLTDRFNRLTQFTNLQKCLIFQRPASAILAMCTENNVFSLHLSFHLQNYPPLVGFFQLLWRQGRFNVTRLAGGQAKIVCNAKFEDSKPTIDFILLYKISLLFFQFQLNSPQMNS